MTTLPRNDDETLASWAWPGGYPLFYITADNGVLCPVCANKGENDGRTDPECPDDNQWRIVRAEANWENSQLQCDNCSQRIESAYADDEEEATHPDDATVYCKQCKQSAYAGELNIDMLCDECKEVNDESN